MRSAEGGALLHQVAGHVQPDGFATALLVRPIPSLDGSLLLIDLAGRDLPAQAYLDAWTILGEQRWVNSAER